MNIRSGMIGKTAVQPGMFVVSTTSPNDPYLIEDVFLVLEVEESEEVITVIFAVPWLKRQYFAVDPQQPEQPPFLVDMTMEQKCTPFVVHPDDCIDAESVGFRFRIPQRLQG